MTATRLFRTIWRVNAALLLLVLLCLAVVLGGFLLSELWSGARRAQSAAAAAVVEDDDGARLLFGAVEQVSGTPHVLIPLRTEHAGKFSSGGSSETRNLLFYDSATGRSRWLRSDHQAVVVHHELLRAPGTKGDAGEEEDGPVRWIRYEIAVRDTDGDGEISSSDRLQIVVSGPAGEGAAAVLSEVDEVLGYAEPGEGRLLVFHRRGGEERAAEIDLAARKVRLDAALPKG
jgi:hypothetical protein